MERAEGEEAGREESRRAGGKRGLRRRPGGENKRRRACTNSGRSAAQVVQCSLRYFSHCAKRREWNMGV
jgi:hypothetical protein